MIRVLVVDDELYIRQEIVELINWKEYGFEIVGQARNGEDALKYLNENEIDLLLTDIEMPFMNGIELANNLRIREYKIKIIFLTAFSEFKYAKKAIDLGVTEYLLKPVEEEDLIKAILKVKNQIEINEDDIDESEIRDDKGSYKSIIVEKAEKYIRKNIEKDINLNSVASHLNISRNYFCGVYKQETGHSLNEYITNQKIKRAKKLLLNENMKVYEVCERLGYIDKNNFSKLFKKNVGLSPLEYKKNGEK